MTLQWVLSMLFLATIFAATAYFFMSFTDDHLSANSGQNQDSNPESTPASYATSGDRKLAAEAFRQSMLEKDKELRDRYKRKKNARQDPDKQGQEHSYRKWRDQKEQTERYLSRFNKDKTQNPDSVKHRMIKSIQKMQEDTPIR